LKQSVKRAKYILYDMGKTQKRRSSKDSWIPRNKRTVRLSARVGVKLNQMNTIKMLWGEQQKVGKTEELESGEIMVRQQRGTEGGENENRKDCKSGEKRI